MKPVKKVAATQRRQVAATRNARTPKREAAIRAPKKRSVAASAAEVANWMLNQLKEQGKLSQVEAVKAIKKLFGSEFVYLSDINELSIDRRVLNNFRKMTQDDVVWVTRQGAIFWKGAHWRLRKRGDSPERTQYEK